MMNLNMTMMRLTCTISPIILIQTMMVMMLSNIRADLNLMIMNKGAYQSSIQNKINIIKITKTINNSIINTAKMEVVANRKSRQLLNPILKEASH